MLQEQFQTGIYQHFKEGDLYFGEGIVVNAETNEYMVTYRALYSEPKVHHGLYSNPKIPFVRGLNNFNEMVDNPRAKLEAQGETLRLNNCEQVKRFALIQALPVEKMQMLLPGKFVYHRYASLLNFVVIEVRTDQKIEVMLNRTNTNRNIQVELISFLNLFKSAE